SVASWWPCCGTRPSSMSPSSRWNVGRSRASASVSIAASPPPAKRRSPRALPSVIPSPHAHARGGDPGSVTAPRARKVVWGPPPRSETWGDRDPAWVNGERRRRWDQPKEGRRLPTRANSPTARQPVFMGDGKGLVRNSSSGGPQVDGVAELGEAAHEAGGDAALVAAVEVVSAEVAVVGRVAQHVVGGHEQRGGHRDD